MLDPFKPLMKFFHKCSIIYFMAPIQLYMAQDEEAKFYIQKLKVSIIVASFCFFHLQQCFVVHKRIHLLYSQITIHCHHLQHFDFCKVHQHHHVVLKALCCSRLIRNKICKSFNRLSWSCMVSPSCDVNFGTSSLES